jgi:hypothetical protein
MFLVLTASQVVTNYILAPRTRTNTRNTHVAQHPLTPFVQACLLNYCIFLCNRKNSPITTRCRPPPSAVVGGWGWGNWKSVLLWGGALPAPTRCLSPPSSSSPSLPSPPSPPSPRITPHHNRLLLLTHVSSPVFRISITGTVKDLVTNRCALLTTLDLALLHAFAASQSHDGSFGLFIFGDVEFNV